MSYSHSNLLNAVFGPYTAQSQGSTVNPALLQNAYAQQGNPNIAAHQAQIQQLGRYNQALAPRWMIDGRAMSIEEFGKEMFGDDTPELTFFLLKYKNIEEKK